MVRPSPAVHRRAGLAAAVVDGTGQVLGSGAETLAAAANAQVAPALSYDPARGRYLAVWADYRNSAEEPDVYGQLYRDYTVAIDYTYDPLERLVRADYSTGIHFAYAFDAVGNRTHLTETTPLSGTIVTTYTFDLADRLLTVTRAGAATAYAWNERGDLLDDGTQAYAWDAAGRLVGVSVADGPEVAYLYDGLNDRIAMVVDGVTTTYVVDPYGLVDHVSQVLVEETAGATTRNLYGLDLLAQAGSTTTTHLAYDALSVRLPLDDDGGLTTAYRYGPFGEAMGEAPIGYGFAGERWDEPVGLLYLRARYYAPEVGRFVSRDPLAGRPNQPGTLNRFVYVMNRPLMRTDPTGMLVKVPPFDLWSIIEQGNYLAEYHIYAGFDPRIVSVDVTPRYMCIESGIYSWEEVDFPRFGNTLDTLSRGFQRILGVPGDNMLSKIMLLEWHVFRSQMGCGVGGYDKCGGQSRETPWLYHATVLFGSPFWGLSESDASARAINEFAHYWDAMSTKLPPYRALSADVAVNWDPEIWSDAFARVILGIDEESDAARYVILSITDWYYGAPMR